MVPEKMIALAKDVKRFAVERLGVRDNPSYTSVDLDTVEYVHVIEARRDRIAWPPAAMRKPYPEGYEFSSAREARKFQHERDALGLDTYLVRVETNAWPELQSHPITKGMIQASQTRLIDVILHENLHFHYRAEGFGIPSRTEEPLAMLFAHAGALDYITARGLTRLKAPTMRYQRRFERIFSCVNSYRQRMDAAESGEERRRLLFEADTELRGLVWRKKLSVQISQASPLFNNAYFLMQATYASRYFEVKHAMEGASPQDFLDQDTVVSRLEGIKGALEKR